MAKQNFFLGVDDVFTFDVVIVLTKKGNDRHQPSQEQ
jgi:hypothetical protein